MTKKEPLECLEQSNAALGKFLTVISTESEWGWKLSLLLQVKSDKRMGIGKSWWDRMEKMDQRGQSREGGMDPDGSWVFEREQGLYGDINLDNREVWRRKWFGEENDDLCSRQFESHGVGFTLRKHFPYFPILLSSALSVVLGISIKRNQWPFLAEFGKKEFIETKWKKKRKWRILCLIGLREETGSSESQSKISWNVAWKVVDSMSKPNFQYLKAVGECLRNWMNVVQERIIHWKNEKVAFSIPKSVSLSVMSGYATPWTIAHQAPLSMGFSRQERWSGLPFFSSRGLPDPGIESRSPALAGTFFIVWATRKASKFKFNSK